MKKHHNDVLGLALNDYLQNRVNRNVIVHSPDFEDDIIPLSYYFRQEIDLSDIEKTALNLCSGKVLDAGAGAGSHALMLQEKGLDVTAIDICEGACQVMKKRGVKSVVHDDIFHFSGGKFDTILMLMNGIGLVQSIPGLKIFMEKIPDLLNPGGRVIFDSTNLIYLLKEEDGSIMLNLNDAYYGEIEFQLEYNSYISQSFNWLYIDFDTLDWIADEAGLKACLILEGDNLSYLASINFSLSPGGIHRSGFQLRGTY